MSEAHYSTTLTSRTPATLVTCAYPECAVTFYPSTYALARNAQHYCSRDCFHKMKRLLKVTLICANPECQQPFTVKPSHATSRITCSRVCMQILRRLRVDQRTEKRCSVCKQIKPIDDFHMNRTGRHAGLPVAPCKVCAKEHVHTFRAANPTKNAEYSRNYFLRHREQYYANRRPWREANRDKVAASNRRWSEANPDKVKAICERYRARKAQAPINDFTGDQWEAMQAAYQHRCVYCNKRCKGTLTQDHITPLSKGGNHTAANIVPACQSCNSKKHTHGPLRPIQPVLLIATSAVPKKRRKNNSTK